MKRFQQLVAVFICTAIASFSLTSTSSAESKSSNAYKQYKSRKAAAAPVATVSASSLSPVAALPAPSSPSAAPVATKTSTANSPYVVINIYDGGTGPDTVATSPTPVAPPVTVTPPTPVSNPTVVSANDGNTLYSQYCAGCHGNGMKGESASSTKEAIDENEGGMGSLKSLSSAQLSAIANAR